MRFFKTLCRRRWLKKRVRQVQYEMDWLLRVDIEDSIRAEVMLSMLKRLRDLESELKNLSYRTSIDLEKVSTSPLQGE